MTTAPKQDPATRTPWQRLTTIERREQVRQAVQVNGMTYAQAAATLGASRVAIAGVVERSRRSADPIVSSSGLKNQKGVRNRNRTALNSAKKAPPKPKHAGFHKFVALPTALPLEPAPIPPSNVWEALPGSTPVAIEHHATGCRFPVGEASPFAFCNLPVKDGPYCPGHSAICYKEPPPRQPRKDPTQ